MIAILAILFAVIVYIVLRTSKVTSSSTRNASQKEVEKSKLSSEARALCERLNLPESSKNIITISLKKETLPTDSYTDINDVVAALQEIANVQLIIQCKDTEEQNALLDLILVLIPDIQTQSHRVLFHSSEVGKIAILRQVRPILHIEFDQNIRVKLAPHIKKIVLVNETAVPDNNTVINKIGRLLTITFKK